MDTGATSNEKRWVVGVDGSPDAEAALMWASGLATDRGERVTPVGVWHLPAVLATLAGRRGGDVDRVGLRAGASVAADQAVAALVNTENVDPPQILEGRAASVLLEQSNDDTVVVVGRRGVTGLKHRLLGSVSQYVVTHATGPVVVVPADWPDRPCQRIVVGFDGSDHSVEALRWALDIASDDTDVVALIAIEVAPGLSPELKRERFADVVESAEQQALAAADRADPAGRARRQVVLQDPRVAFADVLGDTDLVVVGPRGLGGLSRALLGSLTAWLVSAAACPVAVVPTRDSGGDS